MSSTRRVGLIDDMRGFFIIFVVIYHALYDLVAIFGVDLPFFSTGLMNILRIFGASMFMIMSGVACRFSRSNLRRGIITLGCAMLLTFGTLIFMPQQVIYFGILHFMGSAMIIYTLLEKPIDKLPIWAGLLIALVGFVVTYNVGYGYLGIKDILEIKLPEILYETNLLHPLGFHGYFYSSDYYPMLPWFFMFLAGVYLGVPIKEGKAPNFMYKSYSSTLTKIGKHTLIIYLLHQPIIYALLYIWFNIIR